MIPNVRKVVPAYDRFKCVVRNVLRGATTRPAHARGGRSRIWLNAVRRGDIVGSVVRDMERVSSLENQDEELENILICELAPDCRGFKGVTKRA